MTIRGVPDEVGARIEALSRAKGQSINSTCLEILSSAVNFDERRHRLRRYATWTEEEFQEFNSALRSIRKVDDELWR